MPLHALVNNAGISPKSADGQRLDTVSGDLALWQRVYQVNVFAPLMLAKSLLDCLETGSGTVVNVTSIAGSRVHEFAGSAYATSKAALSALTLAQYFTGDLTQAMKYDTVPMTIS